MFIKSGHLHLSYVFLIILVVIQESQIQNYWVALRSIHPFILLRSIKCVPGIPGGWVVKSKLSPRSSSVALRQSKLIHKKVTEAYLECSRPFMMEFFWESSKLLIIFVKMLHCRLNWVLDTPQAYIAQSLLRISLNIYDGDFLQKELTAKSC